MEGYPKRFGPYVLLKPLARGGMGALYLAIHGQAGMEKLCVVKTALPHLVGKGYVQRFRDEASVVVRLSHGNLVTVFDAGQVGGEIFLAMDFVDGKDLRAVWNRCAQKGIAFPVDVAVHIVKELVRGLGYVHAYKGLSLVHRDISPPNVLLSYTGEVKITDFGLAWSTLKLEKTAPGVIFGKVSYMAPEQARGETLDGRTDLYAAGIILWELLTGRQLFPNDPGGTDDEVLERVRAPALVPPSQRTSRVPPELDRICMKALALDPAARYQTGEEFRAELAAFQAKTAPATDGDHVAQFLKQLFDDTMAEERAERETLMAEAVRIDAPAAPPRVAVKDARVMGEDLPTPVTPPERSDTQVLPSPPMEGDEASRLIGTKLGGRYLIRRLCGEGGMGRVYEAEHTEIGKRVALKVLHPAYTKTPDVVERFRREARAASKIDHPNVVNVTDSGTTADGAFFFVMEYIEGIELGLAIHREGPLPVERMLRITEQVAEGVHAAHEAGIIHRDLKPENVLLIAREGGSEFVKVLDFGIAKSAEVEESAKTGRRLTRPGVAMGTPEYMAPEQAAGKPADPRSDIYAVGSIMYEMLTGEPPYDGDNVMEVLHKKANQAPRPLRELRPGVSPAVVALVERAMARNPAARPASMAALAAEVRAVLGALAPEGPLPLRRDSPLLAGALAGAPDAPPRPRLRRPLAVAAVALGVTLVGVVAVRARTARVGASGAVASAAPPAGTAAPAVAPGPLPGGEATLTDALAAAALEPATDTSAAEPPAFGPLAPAEEARSEGRDDELPAAGRRGGRGRAVALAARRRALEEGWTYLRAQRYEEARQAFSRLVDSRDARRERGSALLGLAKIAFQEQRYEEAARRARQAADGGAGVEAHLLGGDAFYKLGRWKDALDAYKRAKGVEPHNVRADRGIGLASKQLD
jgi:serine/threonine protein kinase